MASATKAKPRKRASTAKRPAAKRSSRSQAPSRSKASTKNLADAAKQAGKFGEQMGELTSEVHKTREAMDDPHRSPIEIVLQGLTRRR